MKESEYQAAWESLFRQLSQSEEERREEAAQLLERALSLLQESLRKPSLRGGKRGQEMWALCPYHHDTHVGSFSINLSTGRFFCFVCGARGGIPRLLSRVCANQEEAEAIASRLSPEMLELLLGAEQEVEDLIDPIIPLPEGIASQVLAQRPRMYLEGGKRHPEKMLDVFEVGYDDPEMRVCFLVRDATQRLVGIQSRSIDPLSQRRWKWYQAEYRRFLGDMWDEAPYYEYTPPRKTVLYNECRAFNTLISGQRTPTLVLNEGPGHVLRSTEAGFLALGSFGTYLGPGQLERLSGLFRRMSLRPRVIIAMDADDAGRAAAANIAVQLRGQAELLFPTLPEGADPEDLVPGDLRRAYLTARPLTEVLSSGDRMGEALQAAHAQHATRARYAQRKRQQRRGPRSGTAVTSKSLRPGDADLGHKASALEVGPVGDQRPSIDLTSLEEWAARHRQ